MNQRVVNHAASGARLLSITLEPSDFRDPAPIALRGADAAVVLRRFGRWCGIVLEAPVPAGEAVELTTDPRIIEASFIASTASDDDSAESFARTLALAESASMNALPAGDALHRAARFWWHFDRNTHPALLASPHRRPLWPWEPTSAEIAFRIEAATYLAQWLATRASTRRALADEPDLDRVRRAVRDSGNHVFRAGRPIVGERWVGATATLISDMVEAWYGSDHDGFRRACGAFAAGAIQLTAEVHVFPNPLPRAVLSQGGPDGAPIALFAELALAALDEQIRPTFWLAALRAFVGMLPVFRGAYCEGGGSRTQDDWASRCERGPARPLDCGTIDRLMSVPSERDDLERALGRELALTLSEPLAGAARF